MVAFLVRSQRTTGIARLLVTIVEGCNLVKTSNGRHDPYCEVTMGEQSHTTKTVQVRSVMKDSGPYAPTLIQTYRGST